MKEQLQEQILKQVGDVAEMTKEGIMKAVEVMQEQCPLLVEELLVWKMAMSLIFFVAFSLLTALAFFGITKTWKEASKEGGFWDMNGDNFGTSLAVTVLLSLPWIGVFANLTWLKIWIAPRLFLLEYVSDLIK